jgi:uncharacterized protein YfaP (DUF2135 family)
VVSPEPKTGGSKTVPILIGAAVLAGVGVAVAAGGGGGGGNNNNPTPPPVSAPLAFRLSWTTVSDLDLHVIDPSGVEVYFGNQTSPSGGRLDQDVSCAAGTETLSWGSGSPRGTYVFWTSFFSACSSTRTISFTITVSQGNSVVRTQTGTITEGTDSARFSFVN